jgi:hypothetical protein
VDYTLKRHTLVDKEHGLPYHQALRRRCDIHSEWTVGLLSLEVSMVARWFNQLRAHRVSQRCILRCNVRSSEWVSAIHAWTCQSSCTRLRRLSPMHCFLSIGSACRSCRNIVMQHDGGSSSRDCCLYATRECTSGRPFTDEVIACALTANTACNGRMYSTANAKPNYSSSITTLIAGPKVRISVATAQ